MSLDVPIIFGIVLARLLVPAGFGVLVTISVFTSFAGFISGLGRWFAIMAKTTSHLFWKPQ